MCGRTWPPPPGGCRTLPCAPAWSRMSRSSDVRMVDLFAVGLFAVLAAHLLPPVRALQSRGLAVADPGDRARPRGAGFVAARRRLAGPRDRRHPRRLLAVRRLG